MAKAGFFDRDDARLPPVLAIAGELPEDMLAPFLLIAHAALEGRPCPSDDALAAVYGTRSPGRVRRLLAYIEGQGMIVTRIDFAGKRPRSAERRVGKECVSTVSSRWSPSR